MKLVDARQGAWSRQVDPGVALLEEVHRAAADVDYFRTKVAEVEEIELIWGAVMEVHEERSGGQGGDYELTRKESKAQVHQWWVRYEEARKHLVSVASAALKAGVEERRVRMAERGLDALEEAFMRAMVRLGHDAGDAHVRRVLGEELSGVVQQVFASPHAAIEGSVVSADANVQN